ncbi:crosslink repair DNA glycosylase YcaQ family protein [Alisedimentitalea sp. MJ-SS2]|uniref:winged helix-turn-helix domain-containing protein n=1 Tax=Aliisedimentitalea sp. MJ-SS2 TaxID=3049795 RepID=UPI00291461C3|nr:crosslink repair DNA glycosylase YcaQ family protein [Alisedimentitalea sp. MJ-SS2]MDU8928480.1 crosslink repair DNA glycosylase YcaQ family protein [Alisedimentitalea sp. MJ-SS2]
MGAALRIPNRQARWLWLDAQGLAATPTGALDLAQLIHELGFVQLDTIRVIARAHHHILWSRNQNYREPMLGKLLKSRGIFEHFTHDASVLPMQFLPYWQRQFERRAARIRDAGWWAGMPDADGRAEIRDRIAREGPLSTHDFDSKVEGTKKHMWQRPPHKQALDYMWYAGELATCHRVNFTKFYDLGERVFPEELRQQEVSHEKQIDWLCNSALERMGFGTQGDIQRFWDAMSALEAKTWLSANSGGLVPVEIENADRSLTRAWATADIENRLARLDRPSSRLRILNPFDPVIRDRNRLERLFGFDYRVEMFVPAAQRKWGYYVYPLLEGDRFVGRIEAKADRAKGLLTHTKTWVEPGVKWTSARQGKLEAELIRFARLVGVMDVRFEAGKAG